MITITSFSYKGGAGRTVASSNIAAALASRQPRAAVKQALDFKVALIDLDVFSAGTHRVFEISNKEIREHGTCVQDYLLDEISPAKYVEDGGIRMTDPLMQSFVGRGARACREDFTLFPASPNPDKRFTVQKYHENNLANLQYHLEEAGFDYMVIDGESGTRAMADIAVRLADVVLMFFRLTWQHVEGTLAAMKSFLEKPEPPSFYLIPTCVPLVAREDGVYQFEPEPPGLRVLRDMTADIPRLSELDELAASRRDATNGQQAYGHFWARGMCIHDSLVLKGAERVVVYDPMAAEERAAADYYQVAVELSKLHPAR
jgi:cellulose biosynthesis protein BcsQ